jgi:hypothetical protein
MKSFQAAHYVETTKAWTFFEDERYILVERKYLAFIIIEVQFANWSQIKTTSAPLCDL